MKIIFDPIIYKLQKYGGVTVYFNELTKYVMSTNVHATYISNCVSYVFRYFPILKFSKEPIIFHSSYYRVCLGRNVKNVVTLHDFTYEMYETSWKKQFHIFQKKIALFLADGVVCISENTREDFKKIYPKIYSSKNVVVIHNGVSDVYCIDSNVELGSFAIFVGSRSGYKNFSSALSSIVGLDLKLKVVGGGPPTAVEKTEILELGLSSRVEFLGHVDENELNKLYNAAIALIYPSLYEGFGIPVVEAMKANCPVIAHRGSSITEIAGPKVQLIDCTKANNITGALVSIMNGTRSDFTLDNIQFSDKYSWGLTALKTLQFYKEVWTDVS